MYLWFSSLNFDRRTEKTEEHVCESSKFCLFVLLSEKIKSVSCLKNSVNSKLQTVNCKHQTYPNNHFDKTAKMSDESFFNHVEVNTD